MATITNWNPFGVALNITATGSSVTRKSATQFTVKISASWKTYWGNAQTKYGMTASSGGNSIVLKTFSNTAASSGSGSFIGTYSINGNGSATKTITVTFRNFNDDNGESATKSVSFTVTVPAWISYKVSYNANGGTGAPSSQTKWKDQILTLSSTKPTRNGYTFAGWGTSSTDTSVDYKAGESYDSNASITLYAIWTPWTYKITYNANGGTGAPSAQIKKHGESINLSGTIPTRTNYKFKGWGTSSNSSTASYAAGAKYTANVSITLYAVWELAYTKPKIKSLSVNRYNTDTDSISEDGTSALVKFSWTTTNSNPTIKITYQSSKSTTATVGKEWTATGKEGNVEEIIGNDSLSEETTYTVRVIVDDGGGSWITSASLPGLDLPIDFTHDSNLDASGVAFGKTAELTGVADFGYAARFRNDIKIENNKKIYGINPNGIVKDVFNPMNQNGNCVIGWDNYDMSSGDTNLYGYDLNFGVSNIASKSTYRPYRRRGDSLTFSIRTSGYVTASGTTVIFTVPFAVPIIGSPTVTVSSGSGFVLRQNNAYTHGSSSSTYVTPDSYIAYVAQWCGVYIEAKFSSSQAAINVINNNPIGIYWNGIITFS